MKKIGRVTGEHVFDAVGIEKNGIGKVTFKALPPKKLEKLLRKGTEDARELDKVLRKLFTLGPESRKLVLR